MNIKSIIGETGKIKIHNLASIMVMDFFHNGISIMEMDYSSTINIHNVMDYCP